MANDVLARMAVQISANNARFNSAMRKSQAQSMAFQKSLQSLNHTLRAFGVGFGVFEAARALQFTVNVMGDFEKEMSTVKAITSATGKEFAALESDAIRLGGATKFTASEVAQLQVAYGRLGFNTNEILDATEATLSLAAATGEDLAKSADIAGATVRGFGLDAKETIRVVDVMALSFNRSALDLNFFTESMKYVAPIARAAGSSVEETTALLGILADNGIRGSQAGTALRRIFAELSNDGRPLQERLDELGKKGLSLSDAFDEVGRYAQTALLVLSNNTGKLKEFTSELDRATGSSDKMAEVIQDNLWGDVTRLKSAWEGLILQFREGTGPMSDVVVWTTEFIQLLTGGRSVMKQYGEHMSRVNDEGERMSEWLEQMDKDAIRDAFGEDEDPNAAWDAALKKLKATAQRLEAAKKEQERIDKLVQDLLKKISFKTPGVDKSKSGGRVDIGDEFYHRDINMDPLSSMGLDLDNPVDGIVKEIELNEELATSLANLNTLREEQLDKMHATAEMAVTMGEAIGSAFEGMLNGTMSFAQGLAKVTEEIITLYLRQSIAAMIASAIKDPSTPFPFAKVAVAAAGIGLVKGLFSKIGGSGGGVGGGFSGSAPGRTPSEMGVRITGHTRGYDLVYTATKEGYRRGRFA